MFDARKDQDRCPHIVFPFPHPDSSPPRNYFLLCLCCKVCETAFRVSSVRVPLRSDHGSGSGKKKRALLRIPVMRVLRISNMYPARAPSILPSPVRVPAHVPAAVRHVALPLALLALGDSRRRPGRLRAVGVAPAWLLLFLPCALLLALRVRPKCQPWSWSRSSRPS